MIDTMSHHWAIYAAFFRMMHEDILVEHQLGWFRTAEAIELAFSLSDRFVEFSFEPYKLSPYTGRCIRALYPIKLEKVFNANKELIYGFCKGFHYARTGKNINTPYSSNDTLESRSS
jgi:hypothetical protein